MIADEQFTEHARSYMDVIFRVAFNYLKSRADADDITQNVLLKLYRTDKVFENETHIKYWLIRVTINECKRILLSPWRWVEPIDDYSQSLSFENPEQSEMFDMVMELPAKYRIVTLLYYFEGYKTEEVGTLLGMQKSTVCTHLERARKRLKIKILEDENYV